MITAQFCVNGNAKQADIARAFEEAVVGTLVIKCRRALRQEGLKTLVMAGGVSANLNLRAQLETALAKEGARVFYPAPHGQPAGPGFQLQWAEDFYAQYRRCMS